MLTQTQYEYLSLDAMKKGIYDTVIKESPVIARLPFVDIEGKAYLYNLESVMAGAGWYYPGDTIAESVAVPIQRTTGLKELIGDADVDTFMNQTRSDQNDQMALAIEAKAKAIAHEFDKQFIMGGTTSTIEGKAFDGIMELIANNETTANQAITDWDSSDNEHVICANAGSGGTGALALIDLDSLRDAIKPGRPDFFMTSRRTRRKIGILARASATYLTVTQDQFGQLVENWDGIPILVNDWVPDNCDNESSADWTPTGYVQATSRDTDVDNSLIFAVKVGTEHFHGIQNGGIVTEKLGTLETKDATRTRLKWYVGLCNPNIYALAVLFNFNPDD